MQSSKCSPCLSLGLGVRSFEILEDGGSPGWKGPRSLTHSLEEVPQDSCPARDVHTGLSVSTEICYNCWHHTLTYYYYYYYFKRASLVLAVFKRVF